MKMFKNILKAGLISLICSTSLYAENILIKQPFEQNEALTDNFTAIANK